MEQQQRRPPGPRRQIRRPKAEALYQQAVSAVTQSQLTTAILLAEADEADPATRRQIEQADIIERLILQLLHSRSQP